MASVKACLLAVLSLEEARARGPGFFFPGSLGGVVNRGLAAAVVLVGTVLLVMAASTGQAGQAEATVHVHPDQDPHASHEAIRLVSSQQGEAYAWTVNVTNASMTMDLVLEEGFDVDRPRQLVPKVNGSHFTEHRGPDLDATPEASPSFNLTRENQTWVYKLEIPGPGEQNLTLERDIQPPDVGIDPVENVTHYGFDVTTRTPEPAMGELVLERPDGTTRTQATPTPGTPQHFPVIGLEENATYAFHVEVWDWSHNRARTDPQTVETLPAPNPPGPVLEVISPLPNQTVPAGEDVVIEVGFQAPEGSVNPAGINLFFDKEPIPSKDLEVRQDRLRYLVEGPLEPREYAISVEVPTEEGGLTVERWSVSVEDPGEAQAPFPGLSTLAALALAGSAMRPRTPHQVNA